MTETTLKFRRLAPGKYAAVTPCGHTVIVQRGWRAWWLLFEGGYKIAHLSWPTLAAAKQAAPQLLDTLRHAYEQRQADQTETKLQRTAAVARQCRLADSKTPPADVPWYKWAEHFVGCTAAEIHQCGRQQEFCDLLDDFCESEYGTSMDDMRAWFDEWLD